MDYSALTTGNFGGKYLWFYTIGQNCLGQGYSHITIAIFYYNYRIVWDSM